ncbi:MAG: hypothetical protein IJT04_01230, partial [Bacteroidales bacterium]|nr:hypothetical protein [Bacteroidales bacterium]
TSDKAVRPQSGVWSCGLYGRAEARYVSSGSAYVASLRDAIAVPRIPTPDCTSLRSACLRLLRLFAFGTRRVRYYLSY